tara:strand:+ start:49 stop:1086 length:1038 start_codon:yes stop_codon:yes gene_type:complete
MAVGNLLLQLQSNETQRRLEDKMADEDRRRKRSSSFMGLGSMLGGGAGLLGASLLGLTPVGWGLAGIGGLAALGSGLGSKLGQQWAGGRESQATSLGKNINLSTGEQKEFSDTVKDRYRKDVQNYSSDMNKAILTKAVTTGIKAAAFAGMNPSTFTKGSNFVRSKMGLSQTGDPMLANLGEQVAQAQAGQANILGGQTNTDLLAQATGIDPSTINQSTRLPLGGQGYMPESYPDFMGPSQITGEMPTTLPTSVPTTAGTDPSSITSKIMNNVQPTTTTASTTRVDFSNMPIGNMTTDELFRTDLPTNVNPMTQDMVNMGARAARTQRMNQNFLFPPSLLNLFQGG